METNLEFGIYNPKEEAVDYSSQHCLRGFTFKQIPSVGTKLRFDRPLRDNEGRYAYVSGSFEIDGSEPIRTIVRSLAIDVDLISNKHLLSIALEVERVDDTEEHAAWISQYISDLRQYRDYLRALKRAKKVEVSGAGFSQDVAYLLQRRGGHYVEETARLTVSSFEHDPEGTVQQVEEALSKYGLKLSAGPGWVSHSGPA